MSFSEQPTLASHDAGTASIWLPRFARIRFPTTARLSPPFIEISGTTNDREELLEMRVLN